MFKLMHKSGKYIHPNGGKAYPDVGTELIFWEASASGVGGEDALTFQKEDLGGGCFKLMHKSGMYVHPDGGKANPDNDTKLVLWDAKASDVGGEDALTFEEVDLGGGRFKLKHKSGKYIHPQGGKANPDNDTLLILWDSSASGIGGEDALTFQKVSR